MFSNNIMKYIIPTSLILCLLFSVYLVFYDGSVWAKILSIILISVNFYFYYKVIKEHYDH